MSGRTGATRRRRWPILVACQVVAVILLGEIAVRLAAVADRDLRMVLQASTDSTDFSDADTLPDLMRRSMLGFRPGSIEYGFVLNSRSLRTHEYEVGARFDGFRVVALGDSFTFASGGLPDRDHWTTLLEQRLRRASPAPVEVLRLGVPGTGPAFQLRLWQIEAAALRPDAVVLGFFVGNDFVDHQRDCGKLCDGSRGLGSRLASVSALYRAARNLVRIRRVAVDGQHARAPGVGPLEPGTVVPGYAESFDPDRPSFTRDAFVAIEARRLALCARAESDTFERLLERVAGVVLQLAAEVEATGARFVVMVIPDQVQIDGELLGEVLETTGTRRADYDLERPQRRLVEVLAPAGVEIVDLLPVFRARPDPRRLYRPNDSHWNRHGNQLAAAALAAVLAADAQAAAGPIFDGDFEAGSAAGWAVVEGGENVRSITIE